VSAGAGPQPPVAVAVVSWNTCELLDACLAALRSDADAGLAEVWVVDNGSTDGSRAMVAERHPWVRLELPEENLGFGRAVNHVAERSAAPWIVAANADAEVTPGALNTLLTAGEADPRIAALGPRLVLPDGRTQVGVQPFPTLGDAVVRASQAWRLSPRLRAGLLLGSDWDPDVARDVPWITGAFLLLRRSAFDAAGRFDERQWLYAEDLDVCWRLRQAGHRIRYEPASVVRHWEHAATEVTFGDGLEERWMGATYAWMVRRQGIARTWATLGIRYAEATARATALAPLARRRPDRWERRRRHALGHARAARRGLRPRAELLRVR